MELLPCPFCGSEPEKMEGYTDIVCNKCGISMADAEDWNTRNQWVSVKERLPEVGQWVFILMENLKYPDKGRLMGDGTFETRFSVAIATHWMPLPDAPEDKK